jgi:predicted peroxiredoxin
MSDGTRKLVIVITAGMDDERASVAWSVANGALNTGLELTVFLTSSAVDFARKGAADKVHLNPLDPTVGEMIESVVSRGGRLLVCPPCAKVRGYSEDDLLDGVVITGSGAIHELIRDGAATLSF